MTIEEMKARKAELGYTNEMIAGLSGVPLGTVQKIFAGETKSPRYDTVQKLSKALAAPPHEESGFISGSEDGVMHVKEPYSAFDGAYRAYSEKRVSAKPAVREPGPPRKVIGIADGKFKMPPEEMFFDDEIIDMFEGI